jgi:polyphosphate glucokinase
MVTLGIDIGGSATKGALVDTNTGELKSERLRYETEPFAKPKVIISIVEKIRKDLNYHGPIGAGYPGVVKSGVSLTAANLHKNFVGANIAEMIHIKTDQSAMVLNDADAAGLAEMRFGVKEAKNYHVVMFLTIGTGIGSAIFVDGKLIPNTELGHLQIRGHDAEHLASDAVRREEKLTWKSWGKRFTEVLRTYEFLLNPDLFILGGGLSSRFDLFAEYLKNSTLTIPAKLENMAGIVGAAMAAHETFRDSTSDL